MGVALTMYGALTSSPLKVCATFRPGRNPSGAQPFCPLSACETGSASPFGPKTGWSAMMAVPTSGGVPAASAVCSLIRLPPATPLMPICGCCFVNRSPWSTNCGSAVFIHTSSVAGCSAGATSVPPDALPEHAASTPAAPLAPTTAAPHRMPRRVGAIAVPSFALDGHRAYAWLRRMGSGSLDS